jgi:hypothetical protein
VEAVYAALSEQRIRESRRQFLRHIGTKPEWQLLESHGAEFKLLARVGFE